MQGVKQRKSDAAGAPAAKARNGVNGRRKGNPGTRGAMKGKTGRAGDAEK